MIHENSMFYDFAFDSWVWIKGFNFDSIDFN
jgi:hypothetical protein